MKRFYCVKGIPTGWKRVVAEIVSAAFLITEFTLFAGIVYLLFR